MQIAEGEGGEALQMCTSRATCFLFFGCVNQEGHCKVWTSPQPELWLSLQVVLIRQMGGGRPAKPHHFYLPRIHRLSLLNGGIQEINIGHGCDKGFYR